MVKLSRTKPYRAWQGMKDRCYNEKSPQYKHYGARGIIVCERWLNSFENFYIDMGEPKSEQSLDRVDNNGNYTPENCEWVNKYTQQNNKRSNRVITYNGETMTLKMWSRKLNMDYHKLYYRFSHGYTVDEAFDGGINM